MKTAVAICFLILPLSAQSNKKTESLWDKVLRIAGVSATPSSLRGEDHVASGDIWVAAASTTPMMQRLTRDGGYISPVFDGRVGSVLALKNGDFYRVPLNGGPPSKIRSLNGINKLVGADPGDPDQLLVITKDVQGGRGAALLSIRTGAITSLPHDSQSPEDEMLLANLAGWERVFGDVRLYCEDTEKEAAGGTTIRFTDVYLRRGSDPAINISSGSGVSSCQPSLSADGKQVVFIRGSR